MNDGISEEEVTGMLRHGMTAATYDEHHQVGRDLRRLAHAWRAERAKVERLRARLAEIGETREEWGQRYSGGGYLTRVESDWMRERWPVEQWAWDNTRHGAVVGKRTIIVVEDWQDIRSDDLPQDRPADTAREVPNV